MEEPGRILGSLSQDGFNFKEIIYNATNINRNEK
jgi:hypothetical protein